MKMVYMGTPEFACPALEVLAASDHDLLAVVTGSDKPSGRGRKLKACQAKVSALKLGVPVYQPESLRDESFIEQMAALEADVFIVIAFRILPKKLYNIPAVGSINIHGSLLPKYRGAAPINHALLNGETETGLTSFFLSRKVDQGSIIDRVATPIEPDENFSSLSARLSDMAGPFLLKTLDLIARPGFTPEIQDDRRATPAPKIKPEDALIDWHKPVDQVHNHIRAYSSRPGAFTFLNDLKIEILGSSQNDTADLAAIIPGLLKVQDKKLYVGTGNRPLCLTSLQPEGKRQMDACAFVNGYRIGETHTFNHSRKEVNS